MIVKILNLLLCCLVSLFICCSDSTGPGDVGDGEIVASENIGAGGWTLSSDEIELTVPAGAFGSETAVVLTTAPEKPFEDDAVSETYIIAGLPQSYTKELTVSIAFTGELTENSYIAVGVNTWVSSFSEMAMTYSMLPATVDGNMLTAVLPATGGGVAKAAMTDADESSSVTVTAVTGYKPHVTAQGHFQIDYSSRWTTLASVQELGQYLEEAYITIAGLGFSYESRTNWPVSVTVMDLGKKDGASSSSLWGVNHGYLMFNRKIMDKPAEMRTTAGHEFFHLVQALYDPRNFYSKAKLEAPHLWLDEACSVWIEEKFSDQQNYVSGARAGNVLAPLKGVVAGAVVKAGEHGYGLSAMIKYLVGKHGESCIIKMYEALKSGSPAMTAVTLSTEEPVDWWQDFLQQYLLGEIYGVEFSNFTGSNGGMYRIITDKDTLATFTREYPDLSGGLYVIRLDNKDIGEDAVLSLSVDGGMSEITAIKYHMNPLEIEFFGTDTEELTVTDLQTLTAGGWHVLALVSNCRNIDPYTKMTDITLTVRVKKPLNPGFTYFTLHPELIGDFERTYQGQETETYTSTFYPAFSPAGPGSLAGTTFTGVRNQPWGEGTIVGNYIITFDAAFQNILHIEATQSKTTPGKGDDGASFHNVTFTARDIPLYQIDDGDYNFRLLGDDITDQVTSMTFEYGIVGDRLIKLVDYRGGGGSDISIWLRKQ